VGIVRFFGGDYTLKQRPIDRSNDPSGKLSD
jgi:hypothetical protein